jgi:hypothetical protein
MQTPKNEIKFKNKNVLTIWVNAQVQYGKVKMAEGLLQSLYKNIDIYGECSLSLSSPNGNGCTPLYTAEPNCSSKQ